VSTEGVEPAAERPPDAPPEAAPAAPGPSALFAVVLALLFPGLGHALLGRRARALVFALVVVCAIVTGVLLQGNLWTPIQGRPLTWLATLGAMGMGLPYFLLLHGWKYHGDLTAAGYEYGTAFLLGAGLMNLLLVLDAWDIATGRKE
jgi:hypothetical protein